MENQKTTNKISNVSPSSQIERFNKRNKIKSVYKQGNDDMTKITLGLGSTWYCFVVKNNLLVKRQLI